MGFSADLSPSSQTECVISAKKEAEDEKSTDPKKKRRVSVATPAGGRRDSGAVTSNDFVFFIIVFFFFLIFAARQRKKKTITDVLSTSEPKPGCAADLQTALTRYLSDKRSVIEQEELKLPGESQPLPILTPSFRCYIVMCSLITPAVRSAPPPTQTPASCPLMT